MRRPRRGSRRLCPPAGRKQAHADESAREFEPPIEVVAVRDSITGQVQRWSNHEDKKPCAHDGARNSAGRYVRGDDHRVDDAKSAFLAWRLSPTQPKRRRRGRVGASRR